MYYTGNKDARVGRPRPAVLMERKESACPNFLTNR